MDGEGQGRSAAGSPSHGAGVPAGTSWLEQEPGRGPEGWTGTHGHPGVWWHRRLPKGCPCTAAAPRLGCRSPASWQAPLGAGVLAGFSRGSYSRAPSWEDPSPFPEPGAKGRWGGGSQVGGWRGSAPPGGCGVAAGAAVGQQHPPRHRRRVARVLGCVCTCAPLLINPSWIGEHLMLIPLMQCQRCKEMN